MLINQKLKRKKKNLEGGGSPKSIKMGEDLEKEKKRIDEEYQTLYDQVKKQMKG